MKHIRKIAKKQQHEVEETNAIILGAQAASYPQVSDVSMEQSIAIGGAVLSSELGLSNFISSKGELGIDSITAILPKRTTICNYVRRVACHKIIINGMKMLQSKAVYIATDHGGGVLVKMAFFYDEQEKKVTKINLDFDKSGHTAAEDGTAIKHSISKYLVQAGASIKFKGGSSDSGGGFTGDAMKQCLLDEELIDGKDYIHVPCTEHNDQTDLRRATEDAYNTGGLDHRNLMQFLHAFVYAQQQFQSHWEIKKLLTEE